MKIVDYIWRVGEKIVLNNELAYKYETSFKELCEKTQISTNGKVTLKWGQQQIYIIHIKLWTIKITTIFDDAVSIIFDSIRLHLHICILIIGYIYIWMFNNNIDDVIIF